MKISLKNSVNQGQTAVLLARIANFYELGLIDCEERNTLVSNVKNGQPLDNAILTEVYQKAETNNLTDCLL